MFLYIKDNDVEIKNVFYDQLDGIIERFFCNMKVFVKHFNASIGRIGVFKTKNTEREFA